MDTRMLIGSPSDVRSLTGPPRKINVTLKKRVDYSIIPDRIKDEVTSKMEKYLNTEDRVKVILELLVEYSDHDSIKAFLEFCLNQVMEEIKAVEKFYLFQYQKDEQEDEDFTNSSKVEDIVVSPVYEEGGVDYIKIYLKDKKGSWWSQWKPIPEKWSQWKPKKQWKYECC
jgi:hypothetical protein